jgi:hypothetical protein
MRLVKIAEESILIKILSDFNFAGSVIFFLILPITCKKVPRAQEKLDFLTKTASVRNKKYNIRFVLSRCIQPAFVRNASNLFILSKFRYTKKSAKKSKFLSLALPTHMFVSFLILPSNAFWKNISRCISKDESNDICTFWIMGHFRDEIEPFLSSGTFLHVIDRIRKKKWLSRQN